MSFIDLQRRSSAVFASGRRREHCPKIWLLVLLSEGEIYNRASCIKEGRLLLMTLTLEVAS